MQKSLLLGSVVALGLSAPLNMAFAATPVSAKAASVAPANSVIQAPLRSHLEVGADIYAGSKIVGSVSKVDHLTGNVVMKEPVDKARPTLPPLKRVVSANALSWSNGKLVTSLNSEQISQLPTY